VINWKGFERKSLSLIEVIFWYLSRSSLKISSVLAKVLNVYPPYTTKTLYAESINGLIMGHKGSVK